MRAVVHCAALATLAVLCAALPARAQEDERIAALEADIASRRDGMEALYLDAIAVGLDERRGSIDRADVSVRAVQLGPG